MYSFPPAMPVKAGSEFPLCRFVKVVREVADGYVDRYELRLRRLRRRCLYCRRGLVDQGPPSFPWADDKARTSSCFERGPCRQVV